MRKKLPEPAHVFPVGPSGHASPQYANVVIHATRDDLNQWRREKDPKAREVNAFYRPPGKKTHQHYAGSIHLSHDDLDIPVITHEAFHLVMEWALRNGCLPTGGPQAKWDFEEVCADSMEQIVNQILKELIHLKYEVKITRKS